MASVRRRLNHSGKIETCTKFSITPPTPNRCPCNTTVDDLQSLMSDNQLSAEQYTTFCLERIRQVNPYLKAVIEVNPDAVTIAKQLDEERQKGQIRSKLHGIPVLVKDNIASKDRMQTTAGSWALLGSTAPRDAHVVQRLRRAGAVIIGHANMSEWASCRSSSYSTGFSSRGDQTRNPYDLTRSPRGSSSDSAVSVSSNIVPLAFGTETDTSIMGPAMVAGVVGIKPTVGLTSRDGVIPISKNFDTVGPIGRTVADAAYALSAIAGKDDRDLATLSTSRPDDVDYYSQCLADTTKPKTATFGLPIKRSWELVLRSHQQAAEKVFDVITALGATMEDRYRPSFLGREKSRQMARGTADQSEYTVVKVDAYNGINSYLAQLEDTSIKTIEDVFEYNLSNAGSEGGKRGIHHPAFPPGQVRQALPLASAWSFATI
ncbi:putative amidase signature domain-containing protein [Septoria linicola]|nr:putative amidase signature domain-containing protein [Septoria linicola]